MRSVLLLLALALLVTLAACGGGTSEPDPSLPAALTVTPADGAPSRKPGTGTQHRGSMTVAGGQRRASHPGRSAPRNSTRSPSGRLGGAQAFSQRAE